MPTRRAAFLLGGELRRQKNSTGKLGLTGPEILIYFWRLKKEIVGPLSGNTVSVAAFLLKGIQGKLNIILFERIAWI
jgi:hypothetical protein